MLRSLYINNIAIISQLNLDLHSGMTSVTGETGAGKSIVIDSLALAAGSRADQSLLKHESAKAEVIAEFDISANPAVLAWFEQHEFELQEPHCVLRRHLYKDKPSKSFINDRPVTVQILKELGDQLVNICGQQEYMSLTNPKRRVEIIDAHAQTSNSLIRLQQTYMRLAKLRNEVAELENADPGDNNQVEMFSFFIEELTEGNYSTQDYLQLDEEQKRLAHSTETASSINTSIEILKISESQNVIDSLNKSIKLLNEASKFDNRLEQVIESLTEANIVCEEAVDELVSISGKLEFDPGQLNEIEQRLSSYHDLARKHRCDPDNLEAKLVSLQQGLDLIENRDRKLVKLQNEQKLLLSQYHYQAAEISKKRKKSAKSLSKAITTHLKELNLQHAVCEIECNADKLKIGPNGQDSIQFLVSTNKGQPLGPIEKIASGGELSRISLAIQLEANKLTDNSVLIFDEVDAGISGETADIVGNKLKSMAVNAQVICITHLPQVASKAKHQLKISKQADQQSKVELIYLNAEDRIRELARFLSGKKITEESLANAKVMLQDSA